MNPPSGKWSLSRHESAVLSMPRSTWGRKSVWVGIGASLTAGYAMWSGDEPASIVRVLLLFGIVACVIGLKVTH